jgi:hypothetical protein
MATRKAAPKPVKPVFLVDSKYSTETVADLKEHDPLGFLMFDIARFDYNAKVGYDQRADVIFDSVVAESFIKVGDGWRCEHPAYIKLRDKFANFDGFQRGLPQYVKRDVTSNHHNTVITAFGRLRDRIALRHNVVFVIDPPVSTTPGAVATAKSRKKTTSKSYDTNLPTITATANQRGCDLFRAAGYIMAGMLGTKRKKIEKIQTTMLKAVIAKDLIDNPENTLKMRADEMKSEIKDYNHLKLSAFEVWHLESGEYGELPEPKPEAKEPEAKEPEAKEPEAK